MLSVETALGDVRTQRAPRMWDPTIAPTPVVDRRRRAVPVATSPNCRMVGVAQLERLQLVSRIEPSDLGRREIVEQGGRGAVVTKYHQRPPAVDCALKVGVGAPPHCVSRDLCNIRGHARL